MASPAAAAPGGAVGEVTEDWRGSHARPGTGYPGIQATVLLHRAGESQAGYWQPAMLAVGLPEDPGQAGRGTQQTVLAGMLPRECGTEARPARQRLARTWQVRDVPRPHGAHAGPLRDAQLHRTLALPAGRRDGCAAPGGAGVEKLEADKRRELIRHAIAENPQRRGKRPCGLVS